MKTKKIPLTIFLSSCLLVAQAQVTVNVDLTKPRVPMSKELIGAFFEDINYGADGGLYAELIQNRSFEYYPVQGYTTSGPLEAWSAIQQGGASVMLTVENSTPLNQNNPHYLNLVINQPGSVAGVKNAGFDGIALTKGDNYNFSVYLKRTTDYNEQVVVQLNRADGSVISSGTITSTSGEWKKYTLTLQSDATTADACLSILPKGKGSIYLDMVSLFPQKTFRNRANGLRNDLAQTIADMKPKFLRFPGGCITHGRGLANAYRWKVTVGDVAERTPNWNTWGYHQTYGLGFYEFFQFCEDIGAKALPVLPIGISCQFRDREIAPISEMKPWIDDAIDLVEFANGPVTSKWGAIRASMGHPKPFNLEYICLGNEEDDIPAFRERFAMAKDSLRKYYPGIKIIGTSGTTSAGRDYTSLWKFSRENQLAAVDEHYYNDPDWFLNNIHRYDNFDRKGPKVFIGEWASKDDQLYNAIVEAAYLTGIEKNADVVELTCYAPLLCNEKHQQWHPDLIRFDNTSVMKTPSYYVQQLYSINAGDNYIPSTVSYQPGFKLTSDDYSGMVGVGSWGTQVQYDELKLTSNNKLLYEDNFTAVSSDWTVQDGAFSCLNGVYAQTSEEQPALSINQKTEVSDTYTYTVKAMKTGGAEGFVIPFGYKDAKNYYWLNIGGWGNTQHAIERVSDGRKSTMYVVSGSIKNNQWYDIKVEVVRNVLKCYLDGQLIFNLPDPTGPVTASVTEDVKANDYLIKLVNSGSESISSSILISGMPISQNAGVTTLTGNKADKNSLENPDLIKPVATTIKVSNSFEYTLPPYSFQIFRFSKGHPVAMKPASKPLKKK